MASAQASAMKDVPQRPQCAGDHCFDVAILGAGVGGSTLAAILAHHGVRVLLVEADSHPRFTIGESTIPETAGLLRLIGERYSIPEAAHLATFQSVRHHVSSACGVKRGFTFIYHREAQPQRPEESTQFPTLAPPMGPDVHWFRQDIDSYMFAAAVRYGATARQRLRIKEMQRVDKWWRLASDKGEHFEARYLVDAGGIRSPMAEAYGLREDPPRQRTNSRSMFTHMVGVRPYDQCVDDARAFGLAVPAIRVHSTTSSMADGFGSFRSITIRTLRIRFAASGSNWIAASTPIPRCPLKKSSRRCLTGFRAWLANSSTPVRCATGSARMRGYSFLRGRSKAMATSCCPMQLAL